MFKAAILCAMVCAAMCAAQANGVVQLAAPVNLTDPGQLMEAIGSMVQSGVRAEMLKEKEEFRLQLQEQKAGLQLQLQEHKAGLQAEMETRGYKTEAVEAGLRREIDWLRKDREALENKSQNWQAVAKTHVVLLEESKNNTRNWQAVAETQAVLLEECGLLTKDKLGLWSVLYQLSNETNTQIRGVTTRLDQCEAKTNPSKEIIRRRMQDAEALCHGSGLTAMFGACCPRQGGTGASLSCVP